MPTKPPHMYIAKIEVSDLDAMVSFLGTDEGKEFVKSWSVYIDPTAIFTLSLQKPEGFRVKAPEGEVVVFYFEPSATTPVAWQARI